MTLRDPIAISGGPFLGKHYRSDFLLAAAIADLIAPASPWWNFVTIEGDPNSKSRRVATADIRSRLAASIDEKVDGNLAVGCVFFRSNFQRIDTDNMLKAVLDAATGICWRDDSQVTAIAGFTEYEPQRPRTLAIFGAHQSSLDRSGTGSTIRICAVCKVDFRTWNKAAKFCSRACMGKSNEFLAGEIACAWCRERFRRRTTKQIFCTNDCRMKSLIAGHRSHAVPLPSCQRCGKRLSRHGYSLCRSCWRTAR